MCCTDWKTHARVIRFAKTGRFFVKFGTVGQICTAWSLAPARLFGCDGQSLFDVTQRLYKKNVDFQILAVGLVSSRGGFCDA